MQSADSGRNLTNTGEVHTAASPSHCDRSGNEG